MAEDIERQRIRSDSVSLRYRGIHAGHPSLSLSAMGLVIPGDENGLITADAHNQGGVSSRSPFTSWTVHFRIALNYAKSSGSGGLILYVPAGQPSNSDRWSWQFSPDLYHEGEVLLRGIRGDAMVLMEKDWHLQQGMEN
jgi:hypothetical protein